MSERARASGAAGRIFLVGAGPGDPGLLTLRAAELIASADAVVCDAFVNPAILQRHSPSAELHLLGSEGEGEPDVRDEVVPLLRELAGRCSRVVRLKSGDPFLFGRGAQEALALAELGIAFEVVPGVTAGLAAPAYAGIPLALQGTSSTVTLVKGGDERDDAAWERLARAEGTLVLYAGVGRMEGRLRKLLDAGRAADTPAAIISWGTYPRQRTVTGTLGEVLDRVSAGAVESPALCVLGEVVRLRQRLAWFESRPLFGRRVVITRPRAQAADFVAALEGLGAEVISFPTIRIADPEDPEPLRSVIREVDRFDWIVFTSVNGVERFWAELRATGRDTRMLHGVSLCAIGPATAAAIELEGAHADLVPDEFVAEAVVEALESETELRGSRILLPRAEVARSVLPRSLRERGAEVVEVAAYRTVPDGAAAGALRERLRGEGVDLITFTASSTVRNYVDLLGAEIGAAKVACIGPVTARTARELGLPVHVEAEEYTIPGLVAAIRAFFGGGQTAQGWNP